MEFLGKIALSLPQGSEFTFSLDSIGPVDLTQGMLFREFSRSSKLTLQKER
jgi:hypothetical protein